MDNQIERPQSWNYYSYCRNNPIRIRDLSGRNGWDWLQGGLDAVGCIPGVGEVADGLNAGISLLRGDYAGAACSLVSMIPVAGDAIGKGGKLAKYGEKALVKTTEKVVVKAAKKSFYGELFRGLQNSVGAMLWQPPKIYTDRHGFLTNGAYRLDEIAMDTHTRGSLADEKGQFLYNIDEKELVLNAAAFADRENLWDNDGKAKITYNQPVGVIGRTGELTNTINLYRTDTGMVHATPGN